jgi:hypothetical protein
MLQTRHSLAAEPTQQQILLLAMETKPFGGKCSQFLIADWFSRRSGTCRLHVIFMNQLCIYMGKVGENYRALKGRGGQAAGPVGTGRPVPPGGNTEGVNIGMVEDNTFRGRSCRRKRD